MCNNLALRRVKKCLPLNAVFVSNQTQRRKDAKSTLITRPKHSSLGSSYSIRQRFFWLKAFSSSHLISSSNKGTKSGDRENFEWLVRGEISRGKWRRRRSTANRRRPGLLLLNSDALFLSVLLFFVGQNHHLSLSVGEIASGNHHFLKAVLTALNERS